MTILAGMTILDWVLIGAVIVFAWAGWVRGFVAGVLSFAGFLGGGILGALILPAIAPGFIDNSLVRIVAVGIGVLALAIVGQLIASSLGSRLRSSLTWKPVRFLDNAAGAALNVLALALVTWILAMVVVMVPSPAVAEQVQGSRVLTALDSLVPPQARNAFSAMRHLVASSDAPRVFAGIAQVSGPQVDRPDDSVVAPVIDAVRGSIVRVSGTTPECQSGVAGSGFVVDAQTVITNAHVVAGVRQPLVRVRSSDGSLPATVTYFDPQVDIAVLHVPGLQARSLPLSSVPASVGDDAVIAGFPGGGPFAASAARVRALLSAVGDDIYGDAGVERQVYVLRTDVLPGDSGGPMLDPSGRVLGMVFGSSDADRETGYALAAGELERALRRAGDERVDTGSCRIRE